MPSMDVLYQDKVWFSQGSKLVRLKDMAPSHRRNLIAWLEKRAPQLKMAYEWSLAGGTQPSGEMACDAFEAAQAELWEMSDREWLDSLPLVIELRRRERKYNSPKQLRKRRLAEHDQTVREQNGWDR